MLLDHLRKAENIYDCPWTIVREGYKTLKINMLSFSFSIKEESFSLNHHDHNLNKKYKIFAFFDKISFYTKSAFWVICSNMSDCISTVCHYILNIIKILSFFFGEIIPNRLGLRIKISGEFLIAKCRFFSNLSKNLASMVYQNGFDQRQNQSLHVVS
ncbi:hypothetical protein BpHYR1_011535 [Brachionus plicatilis]|uniref:Uncharacterized protein n=1 Tax=Brachionus plicatilis TaxID=10195 RepID=A0A3M7QZG4_BRAPC|nr:hypothetical protein BpHYR1_011535 [Brachionus plicatilis]